MKVLWAGIHAQPYEHGVDIGVAAAFTQPRRWGLGHNYFSNRDTFNFGVRLGPDIGSWVLLGPGN